MCVGRPEDNFWESVLSFYFYVSYGTKLRLPGLPSKVPLPIEPFWQPFFIFVVLSIETRTSYMSGKYIYS